MKRFLFQTMMLGCGLAATVSLLTSCSGDSQSNFGDTNAIMDEIEKRAKIPAEGRNLDDYVRYYKYDQDGKVAVVYIVPDVEGVKVICINREPEAACTAEEKRIWMAAPGSRLWLKDFKLIPGMEDGGCDYIEFEFDTGVNSMTDLKCNAVH